MQLCWIRRPRGLTWPCLYRVRRAEVEFYFIFAPFIAIERVPIAGIVGLHDCLFAWGSPVAALCVEFRDSRGHAAELRVLPLGTRNRFVQRALTEWASKYAPHRGLGLAWIGIALSFAVLPVGLARRIRPSAICYLFVAGTLLDHVLYRVLAHRKPKAPTRGEVEAGV